ncbi:MAG: hypothetical protein ACREJX_11135, partial [Polyangiaceae bacterium]
MLAVFVAPMLLAACGSSPPRATTAKRNPFRRPPASAAKARPTATTVAKAPSDPPTPKSVIVMPPTAGPFVLLFPDELEAVRLRFVAALASADGSDYVPISDERMRALGERVKKGVLADSGPVCAKPPTLAEVVDAETKGGTVDSLAVASLMLDCDAKEDECILQVSIGGLEDEREAELMLTTKVAPNSPRSNVEPWLAAVGDLMQVDELVGNGYGFGSGKGSELVRVALRETT